MKQFQNSSGALKKKAKRLFLFFGLLLTLNAFSAPIDTSPFAIPALHTDQEKLQYLGYIHEHLPRLFEDAAKYEVNLFKILDDQRVLNEELQKIPSYQHATQSRKSLIRADTSVETKVASRSYEIKPQAVEDWKSSLLATSNKLKSGQSFRSQLIEAQALLGKRTDSGMFWGMISSVDPKILKQGPRPQNYAEQLQMLEQYLPEHLPPAFKGTTYNLPETVSKQDAIRAFNELHALQTSIPNLETLDFLARYKLQHETATAAEMNKLIADMGKHDLEWMTDLDATETLMKNANVEQKLANKQAKTIQDFSMQFTKQTQMVETQIKNGISLIEVPPGAGIFRGCSGGDCSSQYSFPYPNDPHEKVFFIQGEGGRLKGYVTGTVAEVEGKKVFYVITISGPKLNSSDTKLVFRTLRELKSHLGVQELAVPVAERAGQLINFTEIRGVYNELGKGSAKPLTYLDQDIRSKIENFSSTYNKGNYDKMSVNTHAHIVPDSDLLTLAPHVNVKTSAIDQVWAYHPKELNKSELLMFAIDLESSGRKKELSKVLHLLHIEEKDFENISATVHNLDHHSVDQFKANIKKEVEHIFDRAGIPHLPDEQVARLYDHGYANCSDLFSEPHRATSSRFFLERIRELGEDEEERSAFKDVYQAVIKNLEQLPENSKLIEPTLKFLSSASPNLVKLSTGQEEWLRSLASKSAGPVSDLAQIAAVRSWGNNLPYSEKFIKRMVEVVDSAPAKADRLLNKLTLNPLLREQPLLHEA